MLGYISLKDRDEIDRIKKLRQNINDRKQLVVFNWFKNSIKWLGETEYSQEKTESPPSYEYDRGYDFLPSEPMQKGYRSLTAKTLLISNNNKKSKYASDYSIDYSKNTVEIIMGKTVAREWQYMYAKESKDESWYYYPFAEHDEYFYQYTCPFNDIYHSLNNGYKIIITYTDTLLNFTFAVDSENIKHFYQDFPMQIDLVHKRQINEILFGAILCFNEDIINLCTNYLNYTFPPFYEPGIDKDTNKPYGSYGDTGEMRASEYWKTVEREEANCDDRIKQIIKKEEDERLDRFVNPGKYEKSGSKDNESDMGMGALFD